MIPGTKMTNTGPFLWNGSSKIHFFYWSIHVEDSRCYFFENWLMKLKFPNLLKPLGTIIKQNYWSFYHSELFYFAFFNTQKRTMCSLYDKIVHPSDWFIKRGPWRWFLPHCRNHPQWFKLLTQLLLSIVKARVRRALSIVKSKEYTIDKLGILCVK